MTLPLLILSKLSRGLTIKQAAAELGMEAGEASKMLEKERRRLKCHTTYELLHQVREQLSPRSTRTTRVGRGAYMKSWRQRQKRRESGDTTTTQS
jgi:hypothetical protein